MDKIIDGLYLGDIQGASNLFMLKRNGVTHILQVAAGFQPFFPGQFKYKVVNVLDAPFENLNRYFASCIAFIKQAITSGGSVLVHCYAGISRSATVVISYLMQELGLPMYNAMQHVRQRRPIIFPNPGFQKQLLEFERQLKTKSRQQQQSPQKQNSSKLHQFQSPMSNTNNNKISEQNQRLDNQKYNSQSADKSHKQTNQLHYENKASSKQKDNPYTMQGKSNLISNNLHRQDRVHTSQQPHNRRQQHNEATLIKNELMNKLNKNSPHIMHSNDQHVKQQTNRAQSSYGMGRRVYHNEQLRQQRNTSEQLLSKSSQHLTKSVDPSNAYFQQQQQQFSPVKSMYNQSAQKPNNYTVSNSLYSSITKPQNIQDFKQEKNLYLNDDITPSHQHNSLQYSCGLCSMPLFTSKDIVDHNSNNAMVQSTHTQRGHSSSSKSANHQHKFSVNSNQVVFGRTFSDEMNVVSSSGVYANDFGLKHKCGSLFIKRKEWINEQDGSSGNILCPRKSCAVKIGMYCWQGTRCSTCSSFVSPAFQIFRNRVSYKSVNDHITKTQDNTSGRTNQMSNGQKTMHGSFKQGMSSGSYQRTSPSKKKHASDNDIANLTYQEPLRKTKDLLKNHQGPNAMDNLLRLKHDQKAIISSSSSNMISSQQQHKLQKPKIINNSDKAIAKQHSKSNSNAYINHTTMNNLYQQLIAEQNKRLLSSQKQTASPTKSPYKKY